MDILFQAKGKGGAESAAQAADCAIVPVFQGEDAVKSAASLVELAPWVEISPALRDFNGKKNSVAMSYGPQMADISRVLFVGLGSKDKFAAGTMRTAIATAVQACITAQLPRLCLPVAAIELAAKQAKAILADAKLAAKALPEEALLAEATLGALLATYACNEYKSKPAKGEEPFNPASLSLFFDSEFVPEAGQRAGRKAEAVALGMFLSRNLANGPANFITPTRMEEEATKLASKYGFKFEVLDGDKIQAAGMGAFWAVAKGSKEQPRLLQLEYAPQGSENIDPIVIVGKGITFDSGGISLKPSAKMHEMKSDMSGAATVLGLFEAIGQSLFIPGGNPVAKRVIGLMPCAENMPDGGATKPGDVITTMSGQTVEITNTDAEGRLLLCDCLTLAQRKWKPDALLDIATLTGACVVALGEKAVGLYGTGEGLKASILELGLKNAERFWQMPIWDEDKDGLKSSVADMNNVGPREGGANFAALFLRQFIEEGTNWAHLDIAGPAYLTAKTATNPGGASAVTLPTLYSLITS